MKPSIITQQRATLVKQDMRTRTREIIIAFVAKNTFADVQMALLDGKLEEEIEKGVKSIYPGANVAVRKSQLLQKVWLHPLVQPWMKSMRMNSAKLQKSKLRKQAALPRPWPRKPANPLMKMKKRMSSPKPQKKPLPRKKPQKKLQPRKKPQKKPLPLLRKPPLLRTSP